MKNKELPNLIPKADKPNKYTTESTHKWILEHYTKLKNSAIFEFCEVH